MDGWIELAPAPGDQRRNNMLMPGSTITKPLSSRISIRQHGVSLLASAGAAGSVVGLALQPVLKNLFAGIQLAITQPIRINDALLVEGEWGNVEEITSQLLHGEPFPGLHPREQLADRTVMIYLDYSVPVTALRSKVEEVVSALVRGYEIERISAFDVVGYACLTSIYLVL